MSESRTDAEDFPLAVAFCLLEREVFDIAFSGRRIELCRVDCPSARWINDQIPEQVERSFAFTPVATTKSALLTTRRDRCPTWPMHFTGAG